MNITISYDTAQKIKAAAKAKPFNFWEWLKLNLFQGLAATKGDALGVISGATASIMREENPAIPPTVGEMANKAALSLGKAIEKVFTPIKWLLFGVSAVLILWAFIGRKS